jgi:hypothetical protein
MNKLLVIGVVALGAAFVARPLARRIGSFDMAKCIEAMPDTAPPKWMFTNITAIRQNTDRILEMLETRRDE